MALQSADEASQDHQTASQPPQKPATSNGVSSSPAGSQATSPASVLHGVPNGGAPSMPPPVDPNQPKYRLVILGPKSKLQTCLSNLIKNASVVANPQFKQTACASTALEISPLQVLQGDMTLCWV